MFADGLFERARASGAGNRGVGFAAALVLSIAVGCAPPPPTEDVRDPSPAETRSLAPASWLRPDAVDVAYGAEAGCGPGAPSHEPCLGSQTMDVYRPRGGVSRGTLVVVHGGGFIAGDKVDVGALGPFLHQTLRGWGVVVVNYRLARAAQGVNMFPTALRDVGQAVTWLRQRGGTVGLDPHRIVIAGHSAGGTLAALLGVAANAPRLEFGGLPTVDAWVSVAGILDPGAGPASRMWLAYWAGPWAPSWSAAAPATWIDRSDPPGWIVHGDSDGFVEVDNARRMVDAGLRAGHPGLSLEIVDRWSGGAPQQSGNRSHSPLGGANLAALESWLDAR